MRRSSGSRQQGVEILLVQAQQLALAERDHACVALGFRDQRLLAECVAALQLGKDHFGAAHQALDLEAARFDHVVEIALVAFPDDHLATRGLDVLEALEQFFDVRGRQLREGAAAAGAERERRR